MDVRERINGILSKKGPDLVRMIGSSIRGNIRQYINAEEILGEAVIYAIERPERWDGKSDRHLMHCLLWKAKRILVDKIRHLSVEARTLSRQETIEADRVAEGADMSPSATVLLHREEKCKAAQDFLNQILDHEAREAVRLVRVEMKSFREAAALMGKSHVDFRRVLRHGMEEILHIAQANAGHKLFTTGKTT